MKSEKTHVNERTTCTCINKRLDSSLCTHCISSSYLGFAQGEREGEISLARVSRQGFYFCIVLGFISHGETIVLALYFVDESILKKFVGFSSP